MMGQSKGMRIESDALGEVEVPAEALWGASTQRAIENFPISARRFSRTFIMALASIKAAAAEVNSELGLLDGKYAAAIAGAAKAVAEGEYDVHFPLDVYQTGSGTSINMNSNEVIASLANEALGGRRGTWEPVHPNDHVNRCQSSNDVIPSTIHIAAALKIKGQLMGPLISLRAAFQKKSGEFANIVKIGRTHLQDAMPVRLGQVFAGYARQIEKGIERLERVLPALSEIALGGTAVGTGIGAKPEFAPKVCGRLSSDLGLSLTPAKDYFEALSSRSTLVEVGGMLSAIATSLIRIADDIKLMSSGPRLGLGEITIPAVQPGSSIMPGKVNPVIPEMVYQVGAQVIANETAVSLAAQSGHLELNTGLPLIAANLLESIYILSSAARIFTERCVSGIEAREERCREDIDHSLALATALVPKIGYARAAGIAKEAAASNRSVRDVALEQGIASEAELDELLDVWKMTEGG
jgi:fumarate hydratase class II